MNCKENQKINQVKDSTRTGNHLKKEKYFTIKSKYDIVY